MSRYIDADKMIVDTKAMARVYDGITTGEIIDYLEKYSSADVVEVVRCKDCIHCEDLGMSGMYCNHPDNRNPIGCNSDDYCNCGERKEV